MSNGLSPRDVGRAVSRATNATARLVSSLAARRDGRTPLAVRRRGYLQPGDPAPTPGVDVLDYRGVATGHDLASLAGGPLTLGRAVPLGRGPSGPVGLSPNLLFRHAAVVGPSGAGKTTSIMVPWIVQLLRLGCSVVTVDVKGDLVADIRDHAASTGGSTGSRLWVWDSNAGRSHRWNWLQEAQDLPSIEAAVTSIIGRLHDSDPQPHFHHRDHRWLRALIQLVTAVHGTAAEPRHLLNVLSSQDQLTELLRQAGPGAPGVADLNDLTGFDADEYSRAVAGLVNALSVFGLPHVSRVSARSDFDIAGICDQPTLLIAGASLAQGRVSEILSGIMTTQTLLRILERFGTSRPRRPLFFIIDEATRLKDRVDFEQLLAIARGADVGVCLAAQDITQFGEERERTAILANCHSMILLPGCSEPTSRFFSQRLGDRLVETRSASRATGQPDQRTTTYTRQVATAPVLGLREIMHPPFGPHTAIVHVPSVTRAPLLADLTR